MKSEYEKRHDAMSFVVALATSGKFEPLNGADIIGLAGKFYTFLIGENKE